MKTKQSLSFILVLGSDQDNKVNTYKEQINSERNLIYILIVDPSWIKEEVNLVIYYHVKSWKSSVHALDD